MSYLRSAVYTPCRLPVTMFEISRFSRKEWFLFRADVNCPLIIETVNLKSVDNGEEWVSRPSRFNTILEHGYLAFTLYYRQNSYDSNDIFARWKVSICNEGNHFRRAHREYWSRGEILDELVEWTERKFSPRFWKHWTVETKSLTSRRWCKCKCIRIDDRGKKNVLLNRVIRISLGESV